MAFPTLPVTPATTGTPTTINTLPNAGAATAANSLPVAVATDQLSLLATQTTLAAVLTALGSSLPLPTGAATQTTLAAILTALGAALPLPTGAATQTTLASVLTAVQAATPAGTNKIGTVGTNAVRNGGALHRSAITAVDKLGQVGTVTLSGVLSGGSLVSGTTYYVSGSAYNRWGNATPATVVSATPGGSNTAMNVAFAAVSNADGYDIFLSTDVGAPKWLGRPTAAQMAAGGFTITAVGTVTASGSAAAGSININLPGTGLQTSAAPFSSNNAYTPAVVAGVGSINCTGYTTATVHYKVAVTDLRSLPTLSPALFFQDQTSTGEWFLDTIQSQPLSLLTSDLAPLEQSVTYQVNGATAMVVCISAISGQGAALSAWVELA